MSMKNQIRLSQLSPSSRKIIAQIILGIAKELHTVEERTDRGGESGIGPADHRDGTTDPMGETPKCIPKSNGLHNLEYK